MSHFFYEKTLLYFNMENNVVVGYRTDIPIDKLADLYYGLIEDYGKETAQNILELFGCSVEIKISPLQELHYIVKEK